MDSINNAVIDQLARTRGWTLFFAIMLWLGAALLILSGAAFAILTSIGSFGGAGAGNPFGGAGGPMIGIGVGVLYILMALAYIYPALKLTNFSKKVGHLITSPSEAGLASALNEQRAFWKYVGVMMIVIMALYFVAIIGMVIFSVAGAAALKSA